MRSPCMSPVRERRGQATVEMALVMIAFIGLSMAVFDFGRAFFCRLALNEAAALAAEYGTQVDNVGGGANSYPSADQVAARARAALPGVIDPACITALTVNTAGATSGYPAIKVSIAYGYQITGPFLGWAFAGNAIPLTGYGSHIYPQ